MTMGNRWKARAIALAALIVSSALADAVEPFVTAKGRLAGAYQDGNTIQVCCSDAPDASNIALGSLVAATGVCVLDSDYWSPSRPFPKNNSIFIVARSPADIVVLKRPPWWTPLKFAIAASVMAGVIVLILFWNVFFDAKIEEK